MSYRDELGNVCNLRIRLHFRSISMPRIPELTALRNMQSIYGRYGIGVDFAGGESLLLNSFEAIVLSNVNAGTCMMSGALTSDQNLLFTLGTKQGIGLADITVYYVNQLQTDGGAGLAGCATHPSARGCVAVSSVGSPWTLGHEVGHVLGLSHVKDPTNVMHTPTAAITSNPPVFSASQLATIKASRFTVAC